MLKKLLSFFYKTEDPHLEKEITEQLLSYSNMYIPEIFMQLETDERGLISSDVKERIEKFGLNEITYEKPPSWYRLLFGSYLNPFNILLTALGAVSFFLGDFDGTLIIGVMMALSVCIRFIQELRSHISAEKLKAMVSTKATVIRRGDQESPGTRIELPLRDVVPGDIIFLSAGDMLPADVCLISSKELFVSQSSLTGEAMPVEKYERPLKATDHPKSLIDMPNMCFYGTNVLNGTATAVVVATGNRTFFGSIAKKISGVRPLTSFDIGVNQVSWILIRFMFFMVPVVLLVNGFTKGDWFEAFLFSLSVAVGLIPEMLPMIVTANLAKGAVKMSQSKVIVKQLNSIQNFGAMNILCTDKTGTLTQDRIILEKHLNLQGAENEEVLKYGYLNSYYQTGLRNLLDIAVLEHPEIIKEKLLEHTYRKVDEIPFDFVRRRMSVIVEKSPQHPLLICKGAVEEIIEVCSFARSNDQTLPLTEELKKQVTLLRDELNNDGLRVLAVAYKETRPDIKEYKAKDEEALILMGFLAFLDPPKQTANLAIAELQKLQIQVKVLTGDNELVTRKICNWVDLKIEGVLSGSELEQLSEAELRARVEQTTIFVKMTPLQKCRIISSLKSHGHTVGFLGDGINDAPGLKEADIGISVDTAVDIAKESADIIMLEKSLMFLKDGVVEGRKTFANIIKYIKMAISSNFGNVFSILGASLLFPFLPMLPLQLLVQNLLYDTSQITIPLDNVDESFLKKPRKWDPRGIVKFMLCIGPLSSIFDYTTFAILWFVFEANSVQNQALFQTGWFIEGLLSQTLIVHMIRTEKIPFIQSIASLPLLTSTLLIMGIGIYIPYSHWGANLGFVPIPGSFYYWLAGTLICYCILVQLVKTWFIRKFDYWL